MAQQYNNDPYNNEPSVNRTDTGNSLNQLGGLGGGLPGMLMNGMNRRLIMFGLLLLACAVCSFPLWGSALFFGGDDEEEVDGNASDGVGDILDEPGENDIEIAGGGEVEINSVVSTDDIDRDGCAEGTTDEFEPSEQIYVVAEADQIPEGTDIYVRLYYEDEPIEDAPEITADQDYEDICVNFVFEPEGEPFQPGAYEAEFIVNGNPAETIEFEVR